LARKWGTSDVAVLDILGTGPTAQQITGEARGWSKVDSDGPLEKIRISGRLETEGSMLETTVCGCVLEKRSSCVAVDIAMESVALVEMKSTETIGDNTCPSVSGLWSREGKRAVTRNCLIR